MKHYYLYATKKFTPKNIYNALKLTKTNVVLLIICFKSLLLEECRVFMILNCHRTNSPGRDKSDNF